MQSIPEHLKKPFKSDTVRTADVSGNTKYVYFIDIYGLQWEFEQGI